MRSTYRLTLFGRSLLLLLAEVLTNAVLWTVAGILFAPSKDTRAVLGLALLAWTLGLRHALDADHISAIDNATRGLINFGQLPVTCGLFFSIGHSTIVIVVTVAIAISSDVFNKLHDVGTVGGIIGASVSGAFLFIIGLANSIILWRIVRQRQRMKKRELALAQGHPVPEELEPYDKKHDSMLMMRILGPLITFVNRPWKMYPVGVLFGLGFDTASSIALLAVSALAKHGADGRSIPSSHIVILPLLFTAGMTLLDSTDSVLMLYSYAGFPRGEKRWALFEKRDAVSPEMRLTRQTDDTNEKSGMGEVELCSPLEEENEKEKQNSDKKDSEKQPEDARADNPGLDLQYPAEPITPTPEESRIARETFAKMNAMSGLSIVLTLMSILVAFSISLITIMGLIGDNCSKCIAAAEAEDGGGLAGKWWRGWANANEQSGYIGIGIVGGFLIVVGVWYGGRSGVRWWRAREGRGRGESREKKEEGEKV